MISRYSRAGLALFGLALYGGPLLAGFARHAWEVLPVMAALSLLYVTARHNPDLETGAGWAGLAMMAVVQTALVTLVWAIGLGMAGLFGAVALPLWAPLLLTGVAAGLGAWAHRDAAEMDVMLDNVLDALDRVEAGGSASGADGWPEVRPEVAAALGEAIEALRGLDKLDPAVIDPVVAELDAAVGTAAFDAFYDAAGQEADDNEPMVDFALLRFVAQRQVFIELISRGEGGLAPQLLLDAPNGQVRAEARARVADLLSAAAPTDQVPDAARLTLLDARFPGEGFDRLAARCPRK